MNHLSRRQFLETAAIGAGSAALASPSGNPPPSQPQAGWYNRPMRWAQLTLVENDPGQFDPGFWLDYFKRIHADAACLSAGGCVAYYPTKIPLHHRSAWMKDSDPFGDLVAGCRKLGMVVVARIDPHAVHQDVFDAHPDWVAVDAEGNPRRHWASPEMWVTCALGPYNFEFMTEVAREIMARYKVNAIFANRWSGHGMCYCEHCRRNFKAASGMDLPRTPNAQDPVRRAHIVWRENRLFELWRLWDGAVRKIDPAACFIPNEGGGALCEMDMKTVGELAPVLFADHQGRQGLTALWAGGKTGKEYRSTLGRKPIAGIFSVGLEERYRWKDSVQSESELRLWVAEGTANGFRPWFTKFSGTLYDHRWLKVIESVYEWHHRAEKYLRNEDPLARVGMVYSQQTATFYGGEQADQKVEDHTLGFYHALIEARIPFEMVHDRMLEPQQIDRFKLLILPNIAALSTRQCDQLRQYVRRGGSLVATFETSLYNEWGVRRDDFGLADLFGVRYLGKVDGPMRNSYLRIEKDPVTGRFHPILAGLEDAGRIINGVQRVNVAALSSDTHPPLTFVPPYPDLPMEKVYPRQPKTDIPEVYIGESGPSRTVYFPWDIDRTFWEVLAPDHGKLLRNAVEWATGEPRFVNVEGPGVIDVTVWRQKESMTVHLVNLTNPMMMKGPVREFFPVGAQRIRLRLPEGTKPEKVQLLVLGTSPAFEVSAGVLEVTVPAVEVHEVVAIDL